MILALAGKIWQFLCPVYALNLLVRAYWLASYHVSNYAWVQAWIELHRDELMADWELSTSNENHYKIAPL